MVKRKTWKAPSDLDKECLEICVALNKLPGIATTCSCCGHGKHSYMIFFKADEIGNLDPVCYFADSCHTGVRGWEVIARTDCSMKRTTFLLEGPIGDFIGAVTIAKAIEEYVEQNRMEKKS